MIWKSFLYDRLTIAAFLVLTLVTHAGGEEPSLHEQIDRHVTAALPRWQVAASDQCSDAEFVRRIYLDLTGLIPTADASREFLASEATDKRAQLVDQLLASDAFAVHSAVTWDVMLMERRADAQITSREWREYLRESFAEDKPLDKLVAEILGADGVDEALRPASKFYLDRKVDKDALVRDIGRLLLGINLQCAQCHDHPDIEDYLHRHYHGLSVFVAGSKTFRQPDGTMVLEETAIREVEFASVFDPDSTQSTGPAVLDALLEVPELPEGEEYVEKPSRQVRAVPKFSLRDLLARTLPSRETPEFARNMANRLWAIMMGRGLVHPLDMHHAGNPASHPELLDLLAEQLVANGYSARTILREIVLSETYQRSSLAPEGTNADGIPPESLAVANLRGLTPEQLYHSLIRATGSEDLLTDEIELALQEDNESYQQLLADELKLAEARADERLRREGEFAGHFGGQPGSPDGEFQASLPQSLFLANSETISHWIEPQSGNLTARLLEISDDEVLLEKAYLQVFSRRPDDEERQLALEHLAGKDDRRAAVLELVWSMLASAEFRFNH